MKRAGFAVRARLYSALLSVLLPAAAGLAFAQAASPRVTAVRFWSLGEVTRVAIETDGEARYHAERIDSPDRLFVDLAGVQRPAGTRGVQTIQVGDRLVKQIRVAVLQPGVTRVVIDLTAAHEFSISQLTNPDRVIVELRMAGPSPALPPMHSVTGSHAIVETADTGTSGPLETSRQPEMSSALKTEQAPIPPAPPKIEPVGTRKAEAAIAKAEPPTVPKAEQPAAPFVPPAAAPHEETALPEPPHMAPRKQGLDSKPPLETAQAAKRDSRGDHTLIRTLGLKLDRVVLDPGHGGHDTGTVGPGGMMEKALVLDVAKRLGVLIRERLGSEVIYTRSDDTFIPLEERTQLANEKKADLFLSIHANSSRASKITGSETFYLNFTTSEDALEVAARENATSQTSIHELQTLVQKIALNEKVQESRELASIVQTALYSGIPRNRGLKNRGVKKAPFVVLIGAQMPSVLAEIAFLSNPRDEAMLKRPEYRQKIAEALFKGVSQYANTLSHFQVARQQPTTSQAQ
jgi:N-acetylmuramoyl-L-alanine amidase